MSKCEKCKHNNDESFFVCDTCIHDTSLKDRFEPQTNADRIRAMSDEELAVFLCSHIHECSSSHCPGAEMCNGADGLANGIRKWLQQPA